MPVVAACSRTDRASAAAVEALQAGAIDVLIKPEEARAGREMASRLARSVRDLRAGASPRFRAAVPEGLPVALAAGSARHHDGLLLFGAASGGTQAVESLLTCLPVEGPPVLVVLHLPPPLTSAFADRLDRVCPMHVVEARGGELIDPGVAYIAPGDRHLVVEQYGTRLRTALRDGPPVHYRRPAIDVLFHSAARLTGVPTAAAILTGMGQDGADGLLALKLAGAQTFAEDEQSCVVFGMPKEAIDRGAATQVLPLFDMPEQMLASLGRAVRAGTSGSAS
jgi:two-component system chemotaxis response regulator CheB